MVESDIRSAILDIFPHRVVRIEHAPGGTPGLPDILYFTNETLVPCLVGLELKSPKQKLSPAQESISRKMTRNGVPYMFLRFDVATDLLVLSCLHQDSPSHFYWKSLSFESILVLPEYILMLLEGLGIDAEERIQAS